MITVNGKKWSELTDEEKISYCKDNLVDPARDERRKLEFKWYLAHSFVNGEHYAAYNATTNTIETPPRSRNRVRAVVNKTASTVRSVLNYTTRFQPRAEVVPGDLDEETIINARRSGKVLDYLYVKLYQRSKIRKAVKNALYTRLGFWELDWDEAAENGLGQVSIVNHDPFDIYLPISAALEGPIIHSPFIAKVVTRSVDDVRADDRYEESARKEVSDDDELSYSDQKTKILRRYGAKDDQKEGRKTCLVYEVNLWDAEGNSKGGNVNLVTFTKDKLLRDEERKLKEYPIYALQADNSESEIYGASWLDNLIPLNKILDRSISQQVEYNNQLGRFRVIADKGHGVNLAATGRNGSDVEVLEVNTGKRFEQWRMQSLPVSIYRLEDSVNGYIEDVGGAHDASLGSLPAGARSGKTLEALQAADSNNLAGLRESLEDFLSVVNSRILDIVAEKWVASRVIKIADPESGQGSYMRVIGGEAKQKKGLENTTIINKDNEVIIKIGSWLGYTKEAERTTMIELQQAGIIPSEEVLRQFEFPNIESLSAQARKERLEQAEIKADIAGRRTPPQTAQAAPGGAMGGGNDMVALADQENARMMNGEVLEPTQGATPDHSQAHIDFLQSPDAQQNQQASQIIAYHVRGELNR